MLDVCKVSAGDLFFPLVRLNSIPKIKLANELTVSGNTIQDLFSFFEDMVKLHN